jgi:hypothetical protein
LANREHPSRPAGGHVPLLVVRRTGVTDFVTDVTRPSGGGAPVRPVELPSSHVRTLS